MFVAPRLELRWKKEEGSKPICLGRKRQATWRAMARQGATNRFKLNEEMGGDDSRRHVLPNQGQKPPRLMRASSFFCHTCLCSLGRQSWNLQITIKSNQFQAERCRQGFQSELGLKGSHETRASCRFSWKTLRFLRKVRQRNFVMGQKTWLFGAAAAALGCEYH